MTWWAGIIVSFALIIAVMFSLAAFIMNDGEKEQRYNRDEDEPQVGGEDNDLDGVLK